MQLEDHRHLFPRFYNIYNTDSNTNSTKYCNIFNLHHTSYDASSFEIKSVEFCEKKTNTLVTYRNNEESDPYVILQYVCEKLYTISNVLKLFL